MLKSQGSCKVDSSCTSQIKLISNNNNSDLHIQWQKTHYGHSMDLQHIRLLKQDRQVIASKLINGVRPNK